MRTTRVLAALVVGISLLVAGCGGDEPAADTESGSTRTDHNDADVAFATEMIQHHAQALAMVDLTVERDLDAAVEALIEAIRTAQAPEIEIMTDWLTEWDEPIPATVRDHVNAEDDEHGEHDAEGMEEDDTGMDLPGMMSDEQMAELEAAGDAEFQELFLTMMIEHHQGAIDMAQIEQEDGQYPPAIGLAETIAASQTAEIETMRELMS
jgi:uncharacterized protein (DUF305 family)